MGQKVHPTGMRLGIVKQHTSIWYASGPAYAEKLHIDMEVREFIKKRLAQGLQFLGVGSLGLLRPPSGPEAPPAWGRGGGLR